MLGVWKQAYEYELKWKFENQNLKNAINKTSLRPEWLDI